MLAQGKAHPENAYTPRNKSSRHLFVDTSQVIITLFPLSVLGFFLENAPLKEVKLKVNGYSKLKICK